ncbi:MAG: PadR family transcriptional regulator [Anaerolineaceae bacterium]|nr:PadR family transcriptional regulator [Anaerolineaceae bacterium]
MTNAELAILSLVAECPRHGYEIEQIIEARGMREWTEIGFSSIYYLLKKLEKAGLVKSQLIPTQGRGSERRVYQVTTEGRAAFSEATLEALSHPTQSYPSILLGIANLPIVSREQTLGALRLYRDEVAEHLEHVAARAETQRPLPDHVEWLFDYSLRMLEAEKSWVEQIIQEMEAKNDES